jgi:2-phosphosulfolactate phosphatase
LREQQINIHELPRHVAQRDLAGSAVVVIDVLRATTTICQAVAAGANDILPFVEVDDARAAAAFAPAGTVVLGGERAGGRIAGFDLGNSPSDYTPDTVGRRRVIITTTNGTRALDHARLARRVLVGAFVNLSAVAESVRMEPRVDILCAGTDGGATREDILAAGALVARLENEPDAVYVLNDPAIAARREWQSVITRAETAVRAIDEQLALELRDTPGGRNLLGIGLDRDLVDCARIDRLAIAPELNISEWRITAPFRDNRPRWTLPNEER